MSVASVPSVTRQQLSRIALLYFFAAFSACVLLLAIFLPWWLLPVAGSCLMWRLLVFGGRLSFPSVWIKSALVLLSGGLLLVEYSFSVSLDFFVTLLLLGFSLKLLELYQINDAQLLLSLSFFVLMTVFLFDQSPGYVLLVFVAVLLILAAMVAVQSAESQLQQQWSQPLRKAALVSILALPVMLFMFIVMPRLPPLWTMPLQKQQQGKTGMGDSMSPGDITSLVKSPDLVLQATFADGVPDRRELYWYGMTLDHFDGTRWTNSCPECNKSRSPANTNPKPDVLGNAYQVILEPHGSRWAYVLLPSLVNDAGIKVNADGIAEFNADVLVREDYDAIYAPGLNSAATALQDKKRYLALPASGNARARALGEQWRHESSDERFVIEKSLTFYRESFSYTLQPPALGDQRVDDFLFGTRQGFCEHFASSFVFLMRAAGIPARVALGYMGGEVHESGRYVIVRQYDAHAWAEVWLPDAGWLRVDPTAAVAPDRIDLGFFDAFSDDKNFTLNTGLVAFHQVPFLNQLRVQLDHANYLWVRWVLGYEGDQQQQVLKILGLLSPLRIAIWGGGGVALVFVLLCLYLYWREWWLLHEPPATRRYRQLCHAYSLCGAERFPAETPLQYAERIVALGLPGAEVFSALSRQYYNWRYCGVDSRYDDEPSGDFAVKSRELYWRLLFYAFRVRRADKS